MKKTPFSSILLLVIFLGSGLLTTACTFSEDLLQQEYNEFEPDPFQPEIEENPSQPDSSSTYFYDEERDLCLDELDKAGLNDGVVECGDNNSQNLVDLDLSGMNLRGIHFQNAELDSLLFENADLTGADFSGTTLVNISFFKSQLQATKFQMAIIHDSNLEDFELYNLLLESGIEIGNNNKLPDLVRDIEDYIENPDSIDEGQESYPEEDSSNESESDSENESESDSSEDSSPDSGSNTEERDRPTQEETEQTEEEDLEPEDATQDDLINDSDPTPIKLEKIATKIKSFKERITLLWEELEANLQVLSQEARLNRLEKRLIKNQNKKLRKKIRRLHRKIKKLQKKRRKIKRRQIRNR